MKTKEIKIWAFALVCLLLIAFGAWGRLKAGPPRSIVFAAGNREGAYYKFAVQYAERLKESGLMVEVVETKGSLDNLRLVEEGKADIAFSQSGLKGQNSEDLRSLGSMFYEPVWVFVRGREVPKEFDSFKGKRVGVGEVGSGTREVAITLLADNKLTEKVKLVPIGGDEAKKDLINGNLHALFIVGAASIPAVKELANRPDMALVDFSRAKAYSRYHDSLSDVTLYRGMLNLADDIPSHDQHLVATASNLVVSKDFHYALVTLILQTAKDIHGKAGAFQDYGDFPSPRLTSFPLYQEADAFYSRGPSFFYRNLPFYMAATFDRLIIILLPLLTLLLPLGRILPPLYAWTQKRKIYRLQSELSDIETGEKELSKEQALERLTEFEENLLELKTLSPAYQNEVFLLQLRIERVRDGLATESPKNTTPD